MKHAWIRVLFVAASVYDLALGLGFALAAPQLFRIAGFPDPNGWYFVRFAAALVAIFGLMFLAVAVRPWGNRNLIAFGILLKATYCTFVVHYSIATPGGISWLWQIFGVADLLFLMLFVAALIVLSRNTPAPPSPA